MQPGSISRASGQEEHRRQTKSCIAAAAAVFAAVAVHLSIHPLLLGHGDQERDKIRVLARVGRGKTL